MTNEQTPDGRNGGSNRLLGRLRLQPEDIGGPSRMTMLRERQEAAEEIERLSGLLAEAERLCIEHCPDEMSAELRADWEAHQTVAPNAEFTRSAAAPSSGTPGCAEGDT